MKTADYIKITTRESGARWLKVDSLHGSFIRDGVMMRGAIGDLRPGDLIRARHEDIPELVPIVNVEHR